ncbi:DUF882 domain-containing protein [Marinivivus vitaminiproducens]|nr:DUF882 domain-containing protein [Geminicoccaceae bacterium SCSIO 64248]
MCIKADSQVPIADATATLKCCADWSDKVTASNGSSSSPTRRALLGGIAGLAAASTFGRKALAAPSAERRLHLIDMHTRTKLDIVYWRGGQYLPKACARLNELLQDRRTGEIHVIDHNLFDLLHKVHTELGAEKPYAVTCGYRSPASNAWLAKHRKGVAAHSLHMQGMAIDLYLPGFKLKRLRSVALDLKGGGVGYYPKQGFVHLDVGDVRSWYG